MSLYQEFDMQYCDRCKGSRPHSKRGRCLATHRTAPLGKLATFKGESTLLNPHLLALRESLAAEPKPRRSYYNQDTVRVVVAALLSGATTLQQGCRDIGCDPKYLHKKAWAAAKKAVHERDSGQCQFPECTVTGALDCHHRITRGAGGSSNPLVAYFIANLISLCREHHKWCTENPLRATGWGLVIPHAMVHDPSYVMVQTRDGLLFLDPDGGRTLVAPPDQEAS